jgi:hypothetical protein
MRKMILVAFALLCFSNLALAFAPGQIIMSRVQHGLDCQGYDTGPGIFEVFLHHGWTTGSTASQFRIEWEPCLTMTYLSETVSPPYLSIGSAQTGISIAYGSCKYNVFYIMKLTFFAYGTTSDCCQMLVVENPSANPPGINVTDCEDPPNLWNTFGSGFVVNPTGLCYCEIPVENTTWGRIKNLYE